MELENLKRWHWVVIGLMLGAVIAVWRGFWGPSLEGTSLIHPERTQIVYEEIIGERHKVIRENKYSDVTPYFDFDILNPTAKSMPFFRNLSIVPGKSTDPAGRLWVTGTLYRLHRGDPKNAIAEDFVYYTDAPFIPRPNYLLDDLPPNVSLKADPKYDASKAEPYRMYKETLDKIWRIRDEESELRKSHASGPRLGELQAEAAQLAKKLDQPNPKLTILYYLDQLKAKYPQWDLRYSYAWSYLPWANWTLCIGITTLIVGGIWPTLVGLLLGAGFGRRRDDDGPRIKLTKSTTQAPTHGQPGLTADDMARVVAMGDELEKKLTKDGVLSNEAQATTAGVAKAPPAVVKLASAPAAPAKSAAVVEEKPAEDKGFGASEKDFYPTEVHAPGTPPKRDK